MIAMTNETLPQVKQIASRIRELREIIGTDPADVAADIGVDLAKYKEYERGEDDIPIGKLYMIAEKLGVDPTVLLVGEGPRRQAPDRRHARQPVRRVVAIRPPFRTRQVAVGVVPATVAPDQIRPDRVVLHPHDD